jgi:anti-anti-sigma regulatory factor
MSNETIDNVMKLPAVTDLTFAAILKQRSEQALAAGTGLIVDAADTQRISTPCLQVLVAAAAAFTKAGGPVLEISNPSEVFVEAVSTLGLDGALGVTRA